MTNRCKHESETRISSTPINEADLSGPVIDRDAAAALMEPLTDLVIRAGAAILAVNRAAMKIDGKPDGSPVTEADLAADRIIAEGLARLAPTIPAVSEERDAIWRRPPFRGSFFLIDPLDGTKEFIAGRNEFTVNLALVTDGTPLFGIIGAPALGLIWRGLVGRGARAADDRQARRQAAAAADPHPAASRSRASPGSPPSAARMAMPHRGLHRRPARRDPARCSARRSNSAGWRKGSVDIYPRLAPTCEWDIAAGHAIVTAAGGKITDATGRRAAVRPGAKRLHRAGIHRLGRSRGGRLTRLVRSPIRARVCSIPGQRWVALAQHPRRIGGEGRRGSPRG